MTTTAATWFYREPEHNAYAIEERIRTHFWDERVAGIYLDTVRAEPPFRMKGEYGGAPVEMEWQPRVYLTLRARSNGEPLVAALSRMLRLKPFLHYEATDGMRAWEWYVNETDAHKRWREIQGIPSYRHPERLDHEG